VREVPLRRTRIEQWPGGNNPRESRHARMTKKAPKKSLAKPQGGGLGYPLRNGGDRETTREGTHRGWRKGVGGRTEGRREKTGIRGSRVEGGGGEGMRVRWETEGRGGGREKNREGEKRRRRKGKEKELEKEWEGKRGA